MSRVRFSFGTREAVMLSLLAITLAVAVAIANN